MKRAVLLIYSVLAPLCASELIEDFCGNSGRPAFSDVAPDTLLYYTGETVRYRCSEGYVLGPSLSSVNNSQAFNEPRKCLANGTWSGELPICYRIVHKLTADNFTLEGEKNLVSVNFNGNLSDYLFVFLDTSFEGNLTVSLSSSSLKKNFTSKTLHIFKLPSKPAGNLTFVLNRPDNITLQELLITEQHELCGIPETPGNGEITIISSNRSLTRVRYSCKGNYGVSRKHRFCRNSVWSDIQTTCKIRTTELQSRNDTNVTCVTCTARDNLSSTALAVSLICLFALLVLVGYQLYQRKYRSNPVKSAGIQNHFMTESHGNTDYQSGPDSVATAMTTTYESVEYATVGRNHIYETPEGVSNELGEPRQEMTETPIYAVPMKKNQRASVSPNTSHS